MSDAHSPRSSSSWGYDTSDANFVKERAAGVISWIMTDDELIERAKAVLKPRVTKGGRLFGDVGAALISEQGRLHTGVAVDTPGWGLCAERAAMAAMITAGEYKVSKIVAVWRDERDGSLTLLPPCGSCREFMRAVDEDNLEAEIVLGQGKTTKLKDLLPHHAWPQPL